MIKKSVTLCLSSLVFMSLVNPFIKSTIYTSAISLYVFIFFIIAVELLVNHQLFRIILQIIGIYGLVYSYDTVNTGVFEWVIAITQYTYQSLGAFINRTIPLINYNVGVFLVGILLLTLVKLTIRKQRVWLAGGAVLMYFMLMVAFNSMVIINPLFQLMLSTVAWQLWALYDTQILHRLWYTLGVIGVVGVLFVTSMNYSTVYRSIYTAIRSSTLAYRLNLSDMGFYRFFQLNRVTGIGAMSGYSADDSALGGPLTLNYQTAFVVEQTNPTYWKLENKYQYTGKGWANAYKTTNGRIQEGDILSEADLPVLDSVNSSRIKEIVSGVPTVPMPQGEIVFEALPNFTGFRIEYLDAESDIALFRQNVIPANDMSSLVGVTLLWTDYDYDEEILKTVAMTDSYPAILTQLPPSLSKEVYQLARDLTTDYDNQYDKVEAVRKYLAENSDFEYALETVTYTPENMDFVDHFLFETKSGYCEHYSTAMVVLLRAVGIPARWAKGYSTGVVSNASSNEYTIRQADAHAWAEVYYEGIGWVPVEATPSFTMNFDEEVVVDTDPTTPTNPNDPSQPSTPSNPSRPSETSPVDDNPTTNTPSSTTLNVKPIVYSTIAGLVFIFVIRRLLYLLWFKLRLRQSYRKSFERMLHCLNWHIKRPQHMGVEDYGSLLPEAIQAQYEICCDAYLKIRYGDMDDYPSTQEQRALLNQLIKSIPLKTFVRVEF